MWYVQAAIKSPETWSVNGEPCTVAPLAIIGFVERYDADHFVTDDRAQFLGEFGNDQELLEAIEAHQKAEAARLQPATAPQREPERVAPDPAPVAVMPVEPEPKRRGRPPGDAAR